MKYKAYAHFYKNAQGESCRKYLDVKLENCICPQPELVMLMLSPGTCGENEHIELEKDIEVKLDPTLYRVQAFMKRHDLSWVRVLNLSDLQEKSSELFFKKLGSGMLGTVPEHSIFHPSRLNELSSSVHPETPFLLAWGLDKRKEILAGTAITRLKEKGYSIINESGLHLHPLTRPVNGVPAWREYADEAYRSYLASKRMLQHESKAKEEDKLKSAFKLFNNFDVGHPIITAADDAFRRERFAAMVSEAGIRPFLGTDTYDYVYIDRIRDAAELYDILKQHNGKRIVIDAVACPTVLNIKGGIALLEGAVCHLDSGRKREVADKYNLEDRPPFIFQGKIALLTRLSIDELRASGKFKCLLRDCVIV